MKFGEGFTKVLLPFERHILTSGVHYFCEEDIHASIMSEASPDL